MMQLTTLIWPAFVRLLLQYPRNVLSEKFSISHVTPSSSSLIRDDPDQAACSGQCALRLMNDLAKSIGKDETSNLIKLNYNNFLFAMSNATLFQFFCNEFYQFEHCCSKCTPSYSREILMGFSRSIDHLCIDNYKDIKENFGCMDRLDSEIRKLCINICTPHKDAFHSIVRNFRHFILNSDITILENYLNESCEYVLCSLHCDVPLIKHKCGYQTVEKVIALTQKWFKSMKKLSLDTAVINRWPQACAEIITYRIPQRNFEITKKTSTLSIEIQRQQLNQTERNGEGNERTIAISLILSLFINFVFV